MADFRELMEATPPFSLGTINANKVVVDGSCTTSTAVAPQPHIRVESTT
jgi:hypothetical protein